MSPENQKLLREILDRWETKAILALDAFVGYIYGVGGTLFVEFVLHRHKFLTAEGFQEHLFTALGAGLLTSSAYLRQKPQKVQPSDSVVPPSPGSGISTSQ